jgi:hypothetical protein
LVISALSAAACGSSHGQRAKTASTSSSTSIATQTQQTTLAQTQQTTTTQAPSGPSLNGCLYANRHTRLVRFHAPRKKLRAAVIGSGPIGVVLANQTDNTVCEWLPFPSSLAAHGMRVLAFDYGNGDESAEVQGAAHFLRAHGAWRLVLIGASIGGAVVIDAGVHLRPAPAAVISLSAVPEATTYPFPADAKRLRSPIFQIGGTEDPLTQTGADTRMLFRASPSPAKRLLLIPGAAHGTDFVGPSGMARVRQAILAFIRAHAAS